MSSKFYIPRRYLLVLSTFFISLFMYIDRSSISTAEGSIKLSLHLSDQQMGWILSIFALGYSLFQIPAGILGDKFGPRRVLTAIIGFWAIFTGLTGLAMNYVSLLFIRFFFGVGEAGAFPNISKAVFSWIPIKERGLVQGINFSGSRIGAAFALPLVALIISSFGWRTTFLLQALVGILIAALWFIFFRDRPEDHPGVPSEEKQYILENRQKVGATEKEPLTSGKLFRSGNVWLAMLQYFGSNFTFFFCLTWLFPHLKAKYQLDMVETGFYASAPLMAGAVGNWVSGWLVDRIYRTGKWKLSRRLPAIAGFILVITGLIASVYASNIQTNILFFSIAIFGADMTLSPSWSFCIDIGKEYSGAVSGTMNMAGNIGSFITALAFPYLLAWTGSEMPFFFLAAFLSLVSIFAWMVMDPVKPLME